MKLNRTAWVVVFAGICILAGSCGLSKRKKFLDHFISYKYDTLTVRSAEQSDIYLDPNTPVHIKGQVIDSTFFHEMEGDGAEDLLEYIRIGNERGPMAYYKMKLGDGFYFVIIRSGGEYWNSRYFGCIYNAGNQHIDANVLIAENFGDAGYVFSCSSFIKKEEKKWNIYTHQFYQLPEDFDKYELDSLNIDEIDLEYSIERHDEHFFIEEKSKKIRSYKKD